MEQEAQEYHTKDKDLQRKINVTTSEIQRAKNKELPDPQKYKQILEKAKQTSSTHEQTIKKLEEELKGGQYLNNLKSDKEKEIRVVVAQQKEI